MIWLVLILAHLTGPATVIQFRVEDMETCRAAAPILGAMEVKEATVTGVTAVCLPVTDEQDVT